MRLPWSQIDLRWTPHVPGLVANPTTCAAAGRRRCSRACEVHARYEAGTSPEAMSARATARIKSRRTAPARRRHPRPAAQGRVTCRRTLGPAAPALPTRKCHGLPDRYPVISAPPSRPPALRENTGPPRGHTGMHARLDSARQAGTRRRRRRPSVAVRGKPAATPTVPAARTPSAMRPWMPQHSAQQRDKVTR
jgi:hypothetical protein